LWIYDTELDRYARVTRSPGTSPSFSPDGNQVVFQSDMGNAQGNFDLYIINSDGKNLRKLLDTPEVNDGNPRFSPDGSQLLFISERAGTSELYIYNLDDSSVNQLSELGMNMQQAEWSPDGSRIAFIAGTVADERTGETATDVYVIDADGSSNLSQFTDDQMTNRDPAWSPDGRWIIFSSRSSGKGDLWVAASDGSGNFQLTDDEFEDLMPDWAP